MSSSSSSSSGDLITTTTTLPLIYAVRTILVKSATKEIILGDASENKLTLNTLKTKSLSFYTIAPGEQSRTIIIYLHVPYARNVGNIKLGLIDTGGITFGSTIFGVDWLPTLNLDFEPQKNFSGINTDITDSNIYNLSIPNRESNKSYYVYLNVKMPRDQIFGVGILYYKWFFDYG